MSKPREKHRNKIAQEKSWEYSFKPALIASSEKYAEGWRASRSIDPKSQRLEDVLNSEKERK